MTYTKVVGNSSYSEEAGLILELDVVEEVLKLIGGGYSQITAKVVFDDLQGQLLIIGLK